MDTMERLQVEVSHYTYRVAWSVEDSGFVATVAEFPSLSWLAPSQVGPTRAGSRARKCRRGHAGTRRGRASTDVRNLFAASRSA